MRKRDSIEFLWDELKPFLPTNYTVDESVKILSILKQAKAMRKHEIMQSLNDGKAMALGGIENLSLEQYYNETFGGNNEQQ